MTIPTLTSDVEEGTAQKMHHSTGLLLTFHIVLFGGVLGSAPVVPQHVSGIHDDVAGTGRPAVRVLPARAHPAITQQYFDPTRGLPQVERILWNPARPALVYQATELWSGGVLPPATVIPASPATPETRRMIALTFDDGPSPRYTPAVLRTLRRMKVKATFCVVGWMAKRHPELVAAIHEQGHVLCNHTEHHLPRFADRPRRVMASEMSSVSDLIQSITGEAPAFYRSPGGSVSSEVVAAAHRRGMRILGWSVDPRDFKNPPAAAIVSRTMSAVRPGAIVVLHDGGVNRSATVQALPELIRELKGRGYGFRTP